MGEGRSGSVSSSSSRMIEERDEHGCNINRSFWASAAANMFLLLGLLFPLAAAVRRGDNDKQAIDMGEGSAMWTSIGESKFVRARDKGPRALLFGGVFEITTGGESMAKLLRSVVDGKSVSALVLTDEYWTLLGVGGADSFDPLSSWSRRCISVSTRR